MCYIFTENFSAAEYSFTPHDPIMHVCCLAHTEETITDMAYE